MASYRTFTHTGTYQLPDGTPQQGHVEIIPSERIIKDTAGKVILSGRVKVDLDAQGKYAVDLPDPNDTDLNPSGNWGYTTVAKLYTNHLPAVTWAVPAGTTTLDIEDVTPVDPSTFSPTATYVESGTLATVATTGSYADLKNKPTIPSTAADVGALPDTTTLPDLPGVATDAQLPTRLSDASLSAAYAAIAPTFPPPKRAPRTMVATSFGSWVTRGGHGTYTLQDTSDHLFGSDSAKIVTAGDGGGSYIRLTGGPTFNLTGKTISLWVKIDDTTHATTIEVLAASNAFANVSDDYIYDRTYGDDLSNIVKSGDWTEIRFSVGEMATVTGTPNLAAVTDWQIAVNDDATGHPVTFRIGGLAVVDGSTSVFPNGVVSLTFDDCYVDHYTKALPKLSQYGYAGTEYVIVDRVNLADGTGLTLTQLKELQNKHGWEIAAHAYTTANHATGFPQLAANGTLAADLTSSKHWLAANGFHAGDHVAYPRGLSDVNSIDIVRQYFTSARTTFNLQAKPIEVPNPGNLMQMRCLAASNAIDLASVKAAVDKAYSAGGWLILCFHTLNDGAASSNIDWAKADFNSLIDYIHTKGIPVRRVGDVLRSV